MSGIYIPGMEMPTGELGAIPIMIYADGCVEHFFSHEKLGIAVPVPEHGDLVERKAAYDSILEGMVMTGYQSRALDCISDFYVPTIIPAEGARHDKR